MKTYLFEKKRHLALFLMGTVFSCSGLQGVELHVAPHGNDSNPGSLNKPFATITRARDLIRMPGRPIEEDITVNIHGGTYYIEESILLDDRDSGKNGYQIVYKNYNDEVPVIIGGLPVSNWTPHKDGIMKAQVGKDVEFWALLANNKLAQMARDKNWKKNKPASIRNVQAYYQGGWMSEYLKVESIPENNKIETTFRKSKYTGGLSFLQGAIEFINEPGEWALDSDSGFLYYLPENQSDLDHIVRPTVKSIFTLKGRSPKQLIQNIRIEGLELILTDFNANMRCYGGITENKYEYHNCDQPNTLQTALITLENATNNVISKCNLHDAPLNAVALYGYAQENEISNSRMDTLGYSGVYLAGLPIHKDRTEIINKSNIVRNNLISHVMRAVNHATGIQIYQSAENIIEHNLIHTSRRYGISVKGARWRVFNTIGLKGVPFEKYCDYVHTSRNIIRYNYMYDLGADSADGGGIECWGGGRDNVVDHNMIIDAYCGKPKGGWRGHSIFMDDGSNYWTIKNNIVWNTRVPTVNACSNIKGIDMKTFNNVFDISLCDHGAANLEWYVEKSENHDFSRNIIYSDDSRKLHENGQLGPEKDPTRRAFRLKGIAMIGSMDHNLYFNKQGPMVFHDKQGTKKGGKFHTWEEWRSATNNKFDVNSRIILDPQFVNAKERDYRLQETSPGIDMGMTSIDTSKIGPLANFSFALKNDPLRTVFLKGNDQDVYVEAAIGQTISTRITGRTEGWFVADLSHASITYASSNPQIATVDAQGQVRLKGKGRVVISATATLKGLKKTDDLVIYSGQKKPTKSPK